MGIREGFIGALFGGGVGWAWAMHGDPLLGLGIGIAQAALGLALLAVIWIGKKVLRASPITP